MISRLLRARHWQLFVLIFGIPFMIQAVLFVTVFSEPGELGGLFEPILKLSDILILAIPIVMLSLLIAWLYSVGSGLQAQIPVYLRRSTRFFKVALVFPVVYIFLIMVVIFPLLGVMSTAVMGGGLVLFFIVALHLFTMFCIMYCMYFPAKTIKLAELQRPVGFSDFIGEFSLFWFLPIGIWMLQPRINKLVEVKETSTIEEDYV